MDANFDKVVVVTQKTALDELVERFNTRDQARFYLTQMGVAFDPYVAAHDTYTAARNTLEQTLEKLTIRTQWIERGFLPNFLFGSGDMVVTLGRDGLVVNTAKYLASQPILALNPDSARIDGVLIPFPVESAPSCLPLALGGALGVQPITMAQASLNDGQNLYAVNDLFIGQRTHTSARYAIEYQGSTESQSSSGLIISTGAGSTGWFRSILAGAAGTAEGFAEGAAVQSLREDFRFPWDADHLYFAVREPFASRTTGTDLVFGRIEAHDELVITSQMPQNGVIFSDGIEADYIEFNSGAVVRVGVASRRVSLLTSPHSAQSKYPE